MYGYDTVHGMSELSAFVNMLRYSCLIYRLTLIWS
jgi:hypothetical protein